MADQLDVDAVAARCRDLVVEELLRDSRLRREILLAIAREAATKDDIRMLREEMLRVERELRAEIARVEKGLGERLARVEGQLSLFIKLFMAFNVPVLVGIIVILLRLSLGG